MEKNLDSHVSFAVLFIQFMLPPLRFRDVPSLRLLFNKSFPCTNNEPFIAIELKECKIKEMSFTKKHTAETKILRFCVA